MSGWLGENKWIIIGLVLSVVIHVAVIKYATIPQEPEKPKENEPIEVSVIPKEKPEPVPEPIPTPEPLPEVLPVPPEYIPPMPDVETTMDRDAITSPDATEMDDGTTDAPVEDIVEEEQTTDVAEEIAKDTRDIEIAEETTSHTNELLEKYIEEDERPAEIIDEDLKRLADATDIINRIARQKPPEKPGEDSASYSIFEERYASYFTKFKRNVYQIWNYPDLSVARGESGVVNVSFSILKDGRIVNIKLKQTSGYPALDREVMRVLKTMGTVPLPESYKLEQLNVDDAYFIYTLDGRIRGIY